MTSFLERWGEAAYTSAGFFWMALWAFALGYLISSMIQVFVTEKRMKKLMGRSKSKGILLGTLFGFISSSCSFSALATTKSLFKKGASFISSIAFLLASTNLVIELGIIIGIFLGWQFIVGEYAGSILLILSSWLLVKLLRPKKLIRKAREHLDQATGEKDIEENSGEQNILQKASSEKNWAKVARQYAMEWKMVWKDVSIGFTVAGIVAVFIPDAFFETLFMNTGGGQTSFSFLEILEHTLVGPVAAFITFIGSMGNIPLAALLFGKGVSFAGVMAFIFSDLVVFPVLRINAKYYGWKMAFFILALLLASLVIASIALHYAFDFTGMLPDPSQAKIRDMQFFKVDYTLYFNIAFLLISGFMAWLGYVKYKRLHYMKEMADKGKVLEKVLKYLAWICYLWLAGGLVIRFSGIG